MSHAEKNDDVVKPLDNHASLIEESLIGAAKDKSSKDEVTTLDNHASGEEVTVLDNHASGAEVTVLDNHASGETA